MNRVPDLDYPCGSGGESDRQGRFRRLAEKRGGRLWTEPEQLATMGPVPISEENQVMMRRTLLVLTFTILVIPLVPAADKDKEKPRWKKLFDGKTMTGWKKADLGEEGKVHVKEGALIMEKGKKMTGVVYTKGDFPKVNYEVTFEAKRLSGVDFFCTTTFPVEESYCSLVVGGWRGTVTGLSSINGADASENETNKYKEYKNGQWYTFRLRVTKNRIQAWIDKEKMVDLDIADVTLSLRLECRPCRPFGFATWDSTGAVREIQLRQLSGEEIKEANERKD